MKQPITAADIEKILRQSIETFATSPEVTAEKIQMDATFDILGLDSIDMIEIVMDLEEEFSIEIPDDALEGITTVQGAFDYLKKSINPTA